jgi:hypothetical protein
MNETINRYKRGSDKTGNKNGKKLKERKRRKKFRRDKKVNIKPQPKM